ncbi:MAG: chitobiase/beta-hexosaminidase C-terminal domain-containing protein, partial [Rhodothermales bacterium]|nr:chitobiase/beta-hexosaminidase C-terminal domain-containing protein [Rhodothermales bacterium]
LVSFVDFGPTVLSLAGITLPDHLQGRPFLGDMAAEPRDYVFAARDRMDEAYDMMRAVRNERFKYIRNYYPEKPYVHHIAYRDRMPTMQELLRLNASGGLTDAQRLWFRKTKPAEELYDIRIDPHEIRNLADSPSHQSTLRRMRSALESWQAEVGDLGNVPEAAMIESMWPGRIQPVTSAPTINPAGGRFTTCVTVRLESDTDGASVAFTTDVEAEAHWKLYTEPIRVCGKSTLLRARAIRYGYRESDETHAVFEILNS